MTDHQTYFDHLRTRSRWGLRYRRWWLYPRVCKRLRGRTLDLGCGIGDMLAFRANTVGADVNPLAVRHCQTLGLVAVEMQPDALPFADASFDSIILDNVLEHIEQPQPLLSEARRVLRTGGTFLIGVPGQLGWASDHDHKIFYDEAELRARLGAAGFDCREVFFTPLWRSSWLDRTMRQYGVWAAFTKR